MYVLIVTAHALKNEAETFLQKTLECAHATRNEDGNIRYDILQNEDDPTCFVIYEAYLTKEDFLLHRETPHPIKWKTETQSIMVKPREKIRSHSVYFSD